MLAVRTVDEPAAQVAAARNVALSTIVDALLADGRWTRLASELEQVRRENQLLEADHVTLGDLLEHKGVSAPDSRRRANVTS